MQTLLQQRGVKFSFDREAAPSEWPVAERDLGPFIALHVEYGFGYGGRRYIRIQAQHSTSAQLLFDASYDSVIWGDTSRELIYPAMNLYAKWVNGRLRLLPAR
ncbi:MAG TPA: hypothetical protein PLD03_12965 [Thiomonas arsenitoxydans]|nr:hypothetical protein [Thiomonas arsenitoxydans]